MLAVFLRQRGLAWQKVPAHWFFVTELPRTGSGKIRKGELRAQAEADARQALSPESRTR
jgi:acyl-coenzyme A synthetase/AMP-(fatty) acid ligase